MNSQPLSDGTAPPKAATWATARLTTKLAVAAVLITLALGAWFPYPYRVVIPAVAAMPWIGMIVAFGASVPCSLEQIPSPSRPNLVGLLLLPSAVLMYRAITDLGVIDRPRALEFGCVVAVVLLLLLRLLREDLRDRWRYVFLLGVLMVPYGYGLAVFADVAFDRSTTEVFHVTVENKYAKHYRKSADAYFLIVNAWGGSDGNRRVATGEGLYRSLQVGDELCVDQGVGGLHIGWWRVGRCGSAIKLDL